MTGPEHYREAERLLADMPTVREWLDAPDVAQEHLTNAYAAAQVHATLALAAATVDAGVIGRNIGGVGRLTASWGEVLS